MKFTTQSYDIQKFPKPLLLLIISRLQLRGDTGLPKGLNIKRKYKPGKPTTAQSGNKGMTYEKWYKINCRRPPKRNSTNAPRQKESQYVATTEFQLWLSNKLQGAAMILLYTQQGFLAVLDVEGFGELKASEAPCFPDSISSLPFALCLTHAPSQRCNP